MAPVSAPRAFWLLTRLRLQRLGNLFGHSFRFGRKSTPGRRQASGGKRHVGWVLSLLVGALMLFSMLNLSSNAVLNLQCKLDPHGSCQHLPAKANMLERQHAAAADLAAGPLAPPVFNALMLMLGAASAVAVLAPLSSKALAQGDWDMEWLVTLPVRRQTLLWARVIERSVANPTGWFALFPVCITIAWHAGARWSAPLLALPPTLLFLMLAALLVTLCDTGLHLRLPPAQLRNLQALLSLVTMPVVYFTMSLGMPQASISIGWASHAPALPSWTPYALAVHMLRSHDALSAAGYAALLAAEAALLLWLGVRLLQSMLALGVVAGGARESARQAAPPRKAGASFAIGSPLQRRELRLLSRDRNFLAQSLLVPLAVVASQLLMNGKVQDLAQLGASPELLAVTAFGLGAYVLLLSAFQTINTEGHALWMLYTFPRTMDDMLKEKAQLWAVLALAYPLAVLAFGLATSATLDVHLAARAVLALAGIPLFAAIAVSLGVWASNPLSPNPHERIKPTFFYLYTLLSSAYSYAVYTEQWNARLAVLVLMGALAFALWQKAQDALPFLLDPAAAPPPRVSLSDGLIAALLFFTIQAIVVFIGSVDARQPTLSLAALAFAIAGGITYALVRFLYWRTKASGVPALLTGRLLPALGWGAGMALPAIAAAAAYLWALTQLGVRPPGIGKAVSLAVLVPLATVAAPLFEEFIFRGLIFRGMARSLPLAAAMAGSAAIFAVVHPPLSMLPVFVLGLCAALAAQRTRSLLAPMLTHAIYNGAVLMLN